MIDLWDRPFATDSTSQRNEVLGYLASLHFLAPKSYRSNLIMNRSALTLFSLVLSVYLSAQQPLTNQQIWYSPMFSMEYVGGLESMNDGEHYTVLEEENGVSRIDKYAYRTGERVATVLSGEEVVDPGTGDTIAIEGYSFSPDERFVLIETEVDPLYRHSYYAHHYIVDLESRKVQPLSDRKGPKQRLASLSPDGSHAAFVRENDLYSVELSTGK
ncbi:MAG: DPP IV N-terminal domain-containing protein, partial [Flavobacteriales bacterium]|nr:DPP IV N-terminal domain-containing protein [Flavobacteriales bacterium]